MSEMPAPTMTEPTVDPSVLAATPVDAPGTPRPVDAVFTVEQLAFFYGSNQALRDVSLSIGRHEITALIGPSGCGKTTFIRCLNRLNDLIPGTRVEGRIDFNGSSLYAPKVNGIRANMDELVEECLTRAALWDEVKGKLRDSAFSLSGGQQQRLCIARAIAIRPEVILMDEPCSALDPVATIRIEELMVELKSDYTIVVVTHNMQQAARVSDRTAFFTVDVSEGGRTGMMVEVGSTEQMFTAPSDQRTDDYITGRFG